VEYRRLALILDDEAGRIGELALRLVRMGVNVHYANDFDETVLLAQQSPDHAGAVLVPSKRAIEWLPPILKRLRLPPAAVVPAGQPLDDASLESLRSQGVRWALWKLDDDRTARFVVTAAMSETDTTEIRYELRVPTELLASLKRGPLDRPCVIRDLSTGGALVELDPPVPVRSRITLRLGMGGATLALDAKVMWSTESAEETPPGLTPAMGVQFEGVDSETRARLLRFLAEKLQRFRL
jgi:hypothetical protein